MIPKIIHYCWFGGNPLPRSALKCIASWKKFFPDYEIKEWNESNYNINCCDYVQEAYAAKKWAFVSDYVRFDVLYKYGGIYFDVDVEVIKSLDDIINKGPFMGCESKIIGISISDVLKGNFKTKKLVSIAPGLGLGVIPGHELYKTVLDSYHSSHFVNREYKSYTVVQRITDILKEKGFDEFLQNKVQNVCSVNIYPCEYFSPIDLTTRTLKITENTRTIHHYAASWLP
ncbi:MAG: glycosyl transferase, partial [Clostridia bacterium]|nr:glycosyl transferase [Clostridia bacterium]